MKRMLLVEQQIPQKQLQILRRLMDAVYQVAVVGPDEGIAEVPGMLGEYVVGHIKAQRPQILYEKHRRRPGIALCKHMNLPQPRYEYREVTDDPVHRKALIGKLLLLRQVVIQSRHELRSAAIEHGRAVQHPFLLRDIVIPDVARVRIDACEQLPVNGEIRVRREAERSFGQERSDSGRDLVGLLRAVLRIAGRVLLIVGLQERVGLFKGYLALDIADGGMRQII